MEVVAQTPAERDAAEAVLGRLAGLLAGHPLTLVYRNTVIATVPGGRG